MASHESRHTLLSILLRSALVGFGAAVLSSLALSLTRLDQLCIGLLITLVLSCGGFAYQILQRNMLLVWSPMPWFLAASGAYFGFGPLVYYFGSDASVEMLNAVAPLAKEQLLRVTLLNMAGLALVLGVWAIGPNHFLTPGTRVWRGRQVSSTTLMVSFYMIGLPPRILSLLSEYGLVSFIVPGVLGWLANFTGAGLVLLTAIAFQRRSEWWVVWGFMLTIEVLAAIATFSKLAIVLSMLPCVLGYLLYRPSVRALRSVPLLLAIIYTASHYFVSFSRKSPLAERSVSARLAVARAYLGTEQQRQEFEQSEALWVRLNYANLQNFAMNEYDEGNPGGSLKLATVAWIPRLVWKNKPIIESGTDFYRRLTGTTGVAFGMGLFAEAYWNGGWLAVVLCSLGVGCVFRWTSSGIVEGMASGNEWILPIALLWVRSGLRPDGWLHTEIVGPVVFTFLYLAVLNFWGPRKAVVSPRPRTARNRQKVFRKEGGSPAGQSPS